MLPPGRAVAMVLLLLLTAGVAGAQDPVEDPPIDPERPTSQPPETPEPPETVSCSSNLAEAGGADACFPDLIPTNPRSESTDETQPILICSDFVNLGDSPTTTPFRVLLSLDTVPYGEQQFSDTYQRGMGASNVCWENIRLSRGRHTFEIFVDSQQQVVEELEDNNKRAIVFYVGPKPVTDLQLTSLVVTPHDGGVGDVQLFIVNVTNVGSAVSNATTLHLADDNKMVVEWPVPSLKPGQMLTRVHATRPDVRPVGTYYVRAMVDPTNLIEERSEENNDKLGSYTILDHPAPDYIIENMTITGNLTEMRGVRIDTIVKNVGDRAVSGTTVFLVNETNVVVGTAGTRSIVYPGQTSTVQFVFALPAADYAFRAIVDPQRLVPERNESNNFHRIQFTVSPLPYERDLANLIVDRVNVLPDNPILGREMVGIGAFVKNIGTNTSNETKVEFIVDGQLVATAVVPPLRAGTMHYATVPWAPPRYDDYLVLAQVDTGDKVDEIEEGDNGFALDVLLTDPRVASPADPPPVVQPPETPPTDPTPDPTTPDPTTPDPTTPTPTTPTPTTPTTPVTPSVVVGELIVDTSVGAQSARGIISVSLRNPNIQPLGLITVTFKIDDEVVRDVLIQGIRGASTQAATTGQIDIPAGTHTARAEVRILSTSAAPVVREMEYTQEGPEAGLFGMPGFSALLAVLGVSAAVGLFREKSGQKER